MAEYSGSQRPLSVIVWEGMRKKWTWYTYQNSGVKGGIAKTYFNSFIKKHRGYEFTVVQTFSGLHVIAITTHQYEIIKQELEREVGLTLPEISSVETFEGCSGAKKSFSNLNEFRNYQAYDLKPKNQKVVKKKSEETKAHYQMVKEALEQPREKVIMAFDIEVYEYDFEKTLEIGYVMLRFFPDGNLDVEIVKCCHYVIEENLQYKNKDFAPDNRDGFKFGETLTVHLASAVELFCQDVEQSDYLVGHSAQHDVEYLNKIGIQVRRDILDTQLIEIHKRIKPNDDIYFTPGLKKLLGVYEVKFSEEDLHNAGNDAYYTMMLFLRQMEYSSASVNDLWATQLTEIND